MCVYVLEMQDKYFYVGKTPVSRLDDRKNEHDNNRGSLWTAKHGPIVRLARVEEIDSVGDRAKDSAKAGIREDCVTKELMLEHGISKVRGGTYS